AEQAAAAMARALRGRSDAVLAAELVRAAASPAAANELAAIVERLERGAESSGFGGAPPARLGGGPLLAVVVPTYEHVWGRYSKFTRVSVAVRIGRLGETPGPRLVRGVEIEDQPGRAFQSALEAAIDEVLAALDGRHRPSLVETWRYWRR